VNGKIKVHISAKGITALAIDDVPVTTQFQQYIYAKTATGSHEKSFKIIASPVGRISSAILTFGGLSNAYIWMEATDERVKKAILHYRTDSGKEWTKVEDGSYPFEFSVPLKGNATGIEWWIEAEDPAGHVDKSPGAMLQQ